MLLRTGVWCASSSTKPHKSSRQSSPSEKQTSPPRTPRHSPSVHQRRRAGKGRDIIADKVKRHIAAGIERGSGAIDPGEEAQLAQDVYNTIFGLGPLQVLVDDPSIENVLLTGTSVLVMYPDGRIQKRPNIFDSDEELIDWLINLGQRADGGGRTSQSTIRICD